jgi:hypothetical protein
LYVLVNVLSVPALTPKLGKCFSLPPVFLPCVGRLAMYDSARKINLSAYLSQRNQTRTMTETPDSETLLQRLFEQVNQHIETRWAYFSLGAAEKASAIAANLAGAFTLFVFAVLVLFFFSMGFAWWLGDVIQHRAGGFALAGLVFVPIAAVVFRWVRPFVRNKIIEAVLEDGQNQSPHEHG